MILWVLRSSQRLHLIVAGIAAAIMAIGVVQLREAKVDVLPEFSPTVVQVRTEALGLSSAEVERMITTPIEKDMFSGIAFVDEIHSTSVTSLSSIDLVFEPGTDLMDARQLVQERLALSPGLPNVSKVPEMLQPLSSSNRVLMAELSSASLSQMELSVLARWRIRPHLLGVPGVANVSIWANRDRQLQVLVDPDRLKASGVTLQQVVESTANALWFSPLSFVEASVPGTGGFIDGPNQRLSIRHVLPIRTAEDLAEVVIEGTADPQLRLGDVADVVEKHQPLIGDAVTDGDPGLILVVEKLPGANVLEVTEGVETALADLGLGLPGVHVDTGVFRPASYLESALGNLSFALLLGGLSLLIVIALIFASWRAALVTVVSIITAALAAVLVLHWLGATFNAVLLTGLLMALVVIVDEAVADVHAARRRLRQDTAGDAHSTLVQAALAVRGPLVFATLVIVATAAPLLLLGGTSGAFYRELATAYLVAVGAAMVVALTLTPALSALLLSGAAGRGSESRLARSLRRRYEAALARLARLPVASYAAVAALILVGVAVLPALGNPALLPSLKDRDLLVQWNAAPGTSHPEMMRVTTNVASELRAIRGVRRVGAHVGRATTSDQVTEVDTGQLWLSLDEDADYDATTAAVREVVSGYPGIRAAVGTYPEQLIRAARPTTDDLVVRVYGDDLDVLNTKAEEVRDAIATVDGVSAPRVDVPTRSPTVEIEVDLAAAEEHGVTPGDVRRAAAALVQGIEVGNLFEDQKVFDVVVWGVPDLRTSVAEISDLQVDRPDGGQVRLGDVADVRVAANPSVFRHEATSRYLDVTADISGRGWDAVVADVRDRIQRIEFPFEHHAEVVGQSASESTGTTRILLYGMAAALVAFLLLHAALVSWRLTAVLFWVLPAAAAGGIVAMALTGGEPTIGSVAGLLAVVGITARWLVVTVRHLGRAEAEHGSRDTHLVARAASDRLTPVAVTALGVAAAVLPLVIMGGSTGYEILRPLAVTLLGGLVTATALILFVVPVLCARHGANHVDAGLEPGGRQIEGGASVRKPALGVFLALALSGLTLTACTSEITVADKPEAAVVERVPGLKHPQITLTEQAAARTGIETTMVTSQSPLSVPYSALLYHPDGTTWVYTTSGPLSYTRHPVTVEAIKGDVVLLTDGPPPGAEVVTVGVAELYGAELGIGQ